MCLDCIARADSEHLEHFLQRFSQRRRDREQEVRIWDRKYRRDSLKIEKSRRMEKEFELVC